MTTNFEAKLHGFRRTQDGVVVSYVVHPSDVSAELATAPLGTRYMVAVAEMGDDEEPVAEQVDAAALKPALETSAGSSPAGLTTKERRPFSSLPLSQQAAIRCGDNDFKLFVGAGNSGEAANKVREFCGIQSRAELDDYESDRPRKAWNDLNGRYNAWRVDQMYAEAKHG